MDLVLIAALFGWAALIFYNVGLDDGDVGVGAAIVLVGAVIGTLVMTGVVVPTKGDPLGALLEWVSSVYGVVGLVAVIAGALIGQGLGEQKQRGR